jgi:hypothetical protein
MFLALMTLATAANSPALAQQIRLAQATGDVKQISKDKLQNAIYKVSIDRNGAAASNKALVHLGYNKSEAGKITDTIRKVASGSKSFENFRDVTDGKSPKGVKIAEADIKLLQSVISKGTHVPPPIWDGHTWEGSSM